VATIANPHASRVATTLLWTEWDAAPIESADDAIEASVEANVRLC
jgi:hypothetical protein